VGALQRGEQPSLARQPAAGLLALTGRHLLDGHRHVVIARIPGAVDGAHARVVRGLLDLESIGKHGAHGQDLPFSPNRQRDRDGTARAGRMMQPARWAATAQHRRIRGGFFGSIMIHVLQSIAHLPGGRSRHPRLAPALQ